MFDAIADALTAFVQQNNNPLGLSVLFASAMVEYLFPPFPGDTVTLFGAVLVVRFGWSLGGVFGAVLAGSVVGAMGHYYLGYYLGRRYRDGALIKGDQHRRQIERVLRAFRRWGAAYVAINRFLPGIRAVIFLGAGMAGLKPWWVLFYCLISAAIWNALILALGYALGANWEALAYLARAYQTVAWVTLIVVAIIAFALAWWRRRGSVGRSS